MKHFLTGHCWFNILYLWTQSSNAEFLFNTQHVSSSAFRKSNINIFVPGNINNKNSSSGRSSFLYFTHKMLTATFQPASPSHWPTLIEIPVSNSEWWSHFFLIRGRNHFIFNFRVLNSRKCFSVIQGDLETSSTVQGIISPKYTEQKPLKNEVQIISCRPTLHTHSATLA
jgi:hypothetical protein